MSEIKILGPHGVEVIHVRALVDCIDTLERELREQRRKHDALPTPDHIAAVRLLEKLGRRNQTSAHW